MRPARAFGGGIPGGGPVTTKLVIGIAVASILFSIGLRTSVGRELATHLLFSPARVLDGELWQVVTYAFLYPIAGDGMRVFGFLISLVFLHSMGGTLEARLGSRRFLGFYVGTAALGALLTVPCALLLGEAGRVYDGVWVALSALVILFATELPHGQVNLMFVLPVRGRGLVIASFAILGLYAIASGVAAVLPELFSMLVALAFAGGLFQPRRAWLRFRAWRIERQLRRRSSHLSVIRGGGDDEGPPTGGGTRGGHGKGGNGGGPYLH